MQAVGINLPRGWDGSDRRSMIFVRDDRTELHTLWHYDGDGNHARPLCYDEPVRPTDALAALAAAPRCIQFARAAPRDRAEALWVLALIAARGW